MTKQETVQVLVVDDDRSALDSLSEVLEKEGYTTTRVSSGSEAVKTVASQPFDLVLTDLRMRDVDGMKVLEAVRSHQADTPVIVMTAFAAMDTAIEAIRKGAYDYLSKPFKLDHLRVVVKRALDQASLRKENQRLRSDLEEREFETEIIGRSPEMVEVYKMIARVAALETTVLIQGASGTGKEMVARLIHRTSGRKGPFLAINCGALTETLLESELFGHVKGAFTGATSSKIGIFEASQWGTCFLDEISSTTPALQMKLLRVLEEHEVRRVGSVEPVKVKVRILAATNQPLEGLVKDGSFREDLYYRLKVVTINLPSLKERRADIPLLVDHFVRKYAKRADRAVALDDSLYSALTTYDWPGNVRELENAVERAIALNSSGVLTIEDFPQEIKEAHEHGPPRSSGLMPTLAEKEKEYVLEVLEATGQNVSRAAEVLGIDRRTVYRILERHGIRRD